MYLSNFEARAFFSGKPAHVHGRECIGVSALRFSLMCTVSKLKGRQQAMFSFFFTSEKSQINLGISISGLINVLSTAISSSLFSFKID